MLPQADHLIETVGIATAAPESRAQQPAVSGGADWIPFLTVLGPVLIALITGWFSWRAGAQKASQDAAGSIQSGFQMLVGKLQEERAELVKMVDKQAAENVALRYEVSTLTKTVSSLEKKIDDIIRRWKRGEPPPEDEDGTNRP